MTCARRRTRQSIPFVKRPERTYEETGLYYYGARYLDPKTSVWLSADPALGEYIPVAPVDDDAKKHNQNLPGMGGVFNTVNLHLYHYAGNNPVKYTDPDGKWLGLDDVVTGPIDEILVCAALLIMAKIGSEWAKARLDDFENFFASLLDIPEPPDPSDWIASTGQPDYPQIPGGMPEPPKSFWGKLAFVFAKLADLASNWPGAGGVK